MSTRDERPEQLFDLFCGGQVHPSEIAAMDLETVTRQIHELREAEPDEIPMSDQEIAGHVLDFARRA